MINKKLDNIIEDITILKEIFNSTDYFKKLEEVIDKQNNYNKELELKLNHLQSKIDKAIEFVEEYKKQWVENDEVVNDMNNLGNILKEDK